MITRRDLAMLAAVSVITRPAWAQDLMPAGACDSHVHVIGPASRFPMLPNRAYTPPEASVADLLKLRARLGISRNVIVQPSFYGADNAQLLEALAALGDSARGVAVVPPDVADAELTRLHAAGVRAVRVNVESVANRDPRDAARDLAPLAARIGALGWHIEIYAALGVIATIAPQLADLPVPVVFDHFGVPVAAEGTGQPAWATLMDLVRSHKAFVTLSGAYRISRDPTYADVTPFARALIAAAPDRLLWASDWPHTTRAPGVKPTDTSPFLPIDDLAQVRMLAEWCPDAATRRTILVDTPARLYQFSAL